ncbi:hypothetical protein FHX37_4447 [Haloactinospora alba]|uniref:Antitoxin n=1 Tax=Haloactinospora alba TaxID=405555 RepID=A0A543N7B3_9ACTN|nr:prevent-host-death protein [Haloactinospora alba]TQN27718.1 hypothetical protein FHX37_4447 [Haloactinospora alba]
MPREISQRELRNGSGAILEAAAGGEISVVTRNGTPMAELRPLGERTFADTDEALRAAARMPPVDSARLRDELDGALDQEPFGE